MRKRQYLPGSPRGSLLKEKEKVKEEFVTISITPTNQGIDLFIKSPMFAHFVESKGSVIKSNRDDPGAWLTSRNPGWVGHKGWLVKSNNAFKYMCYWGEALEVDGYPNLSFFLDDKLAEGVTFSLRGIFPPDVCKTFIKKAESEMVKIYKEHIGKIHMTVKVPMSEVE